MNSSMRASHGTSFSRLTKAGRIDARCVTNVRTEVMYGQVGAADSLSLDTRLTASTAIDSIVAKSCMAICNCCEDPGLRRPL